MPSDKTFNFFDRAVAFCLYFFFAAIPFSKTGVDGSVLFAFLFYIPRKFIRPQFDVFKNNMNLVALLFALLCAVSISQSGLYWEKSSKAFFLKWCQNFFIFWMAQDIFSNPKRFGKVTALFLASAGVALLNGLIQKISGHEYLLGRLMTEVKLSYPLAPEKIYYAITSTFSHSNSFAAYAGFSFLFAAPLFLRESHAWRKAYLGLVVLLSAICLLFTFSRGAWLGALLGFLVLLFFSVRKRDALGVGLFFVILLFFIYYPVRERIFFSWGIHGDSDRFELLELTWQIIRRSPWLGNGLGTFMDYCAAYSNHEIIKYAHNCYLQIWAESGIFALLLFLAFIFFLFVEGIEKYLASKDAVLLGLLAGLSGYLVHMGFDTHLYSLQIAALFWGMTGLLAARSRIFS